MRKKVALLIVQENTDSPRQVGVVDDGDDCMVDAVSPKDVRGRLSSFNKALQEISENIGKDALVAAGHRMNTLLTEAHDQRDGMIIFCYPLILYSMHSRC